MVNKGDKMLETVIKQKLSTIDEVLKQYNETIYNKASEYEIKKFCDSHLNIYKNLSLDSEYIKFITKSNAFDYNGLSIYSIDEKREYNIYDLNDIYWENENLKKYLFLAEDSLSWYVLEIYNKNYYILDKPSGTIISKYKSFNELILVAMENVL